MRKSFEILLVTGIAAVSLSGCWYHRLAGPCYGNGCPAFATSAQSKAAVAPSAPAGNAQAQNAAAAGAPATAADAQASPAQAPAPAGAGDANQAKPGRFTRMLTALHLHSKS